MFFQVNEMLVEVTVLNVKSHGATHGAIYMYVYIIEYDDNLEQSKIQNSYLLLV